MRGKRNIGAPHIMKEAKSFEECKSLCETSSSECLGISWSSNSCAMIRGASHWVESSDLSLRSFIAIPKIKPSRMHTMALFFAELALFVFLVCWIVFKTKKT